MPSTESDPFYRGHPRRALPFGQVSAVAIGGALGGPARYLVNRAVPVEPGRFPVATLIVNVVGSLALCLLLVLILEVWPPSKYLRPFAATGFIGAFTTYGTVMVEVDERMRDGHAWLASGYLGTTLAAGMLAAYLGLTLGRTAARRRRAGQEGEAR